MNVAVPARNTFLPRAAPASNLYEYVRCNMSELNTPLRVVLEIDVPGDCVRDD